MAAPTDREAYWKGKWEKGDTTWHRDHVEPLLQKHFHLITTRNGADEQAPRQAQQLSIFVPLCGKTLDMIWLCEQGHIVVGCELSEIAAMEFFTENKIPYKTYQVENLTIHEATDRNLKFAVGDLFDCTPDNIGLFDAVWDCNSFGAITPQERNKYRDKISSLTQPQARVLLSAYEYDQSLRSRAPYSITPELGRASFEGVYKHKLVETVNMEGSPFLKRFDFPWALRHIHYLEKLT